jgi:cardiolipin synthase A/B
VERFTTGNAISLLRSGAEFFPALIEAIDAAETEVWLETYIFADDLSGRAVAAAMVGAAQRGVAVRVLVDGWGARQYLTPALAQVLSAGGVRLMKYRPEVAPWQFRLHRLRRLHRKICHVDGRVAFVGGINLIDDMNTPRHKPPRVDFAVRVEGPMLAAVVMTMQRLWALVELTQFDRSDVPLFPVPIPTRAAGTQFASFAIRDNLGHRRDIEAAYLSAIRMAGKEIVIATAYFFPGTQFRRALAAAAKRGVKVTLLLQARVEYRLLHYAARALYGQLLAAGVNIEEYHRSFLHAKVAVVDGQWATVGSSNIDPYSLLMAREANVFVRDPRFANQLRQELLQMIGDGAVRVAPERWAGRSNVERALTWIAYGIVRIGMGVMGYGGNEWFRRGENRGA